MVLGDLVIGTQQKSCQSEFELPKGSVLADERGDAHSSVQPSAVGTLPIQVSAAVFFSRHLARNP
jgi:hypothetical protein